MRHAIVCCVLGSPLALVAMVAGVGAGAAEPASARIAHPAMPTAATRAEAARKAVDPVLERGLEAILAMVPERNGIRFCDCPNCTMGTQAGQIVWNGPDDPDRVHCRFCNHVYPSEQYPMDQVIAFRNRRGQAVEWRYHLTPDGDRCFFDARARYERKTWSARLALQLADAWVATDEARYADAGAALLYEISQRYAGWSFVHDQVNGADGPVPDAAEPYPYWGGIWSRWFYADAPTSVAYAYDRLYSSGAFERLSASLGRDVKAAIETDMLHASIAFVRSYKEYYSNMSPVIYQSLVVYGRVLNRPDYVHDGIRRTEELLRRQFFVDGMWMEGSHSYHRQAIGLLQGVFQAAKGYSDPADVVPEGGRTRLVDLDMQRDLPFVRKAIQAAAALAFPDGRVVAVHDTWPGRGQEPTARNDALLMPGMRHARLARGEAETAMQAHLHFSGGHGHQHGDHLNLILWAHGRELLNDIGYTHSAWRAWVVRSLAHNTVVIDQTNQHTAGIGGNVTLFAPLSADLQAVEAQSLVAYPGRASEYRRRLLVVGVGAADAYLVDVFRVAGGSRHDWVLHGSADLPQEVTLSLPATPVPGNLIGVDAVVELPRSESSRGTFPPGLDAAYAFPKDLEAATTPEAWSATFAFTDGAGPRLRVDVLGQSDTQVCRMRSPSIRNAGENDAELPKHTMPSVMARRVAAAGPLESAFVAVHQPYAERPILRSVRALLPPGGAAAPVALRVEHDAGVDVILSAPTRPAVPIAVDTDGLHLECDGRLGFIRLVDGVAIRAALIGGTRLNAPGVALEAAVPVLSAPIAAVRRDADTGTFAIVLEGPLALPPWQPGVAGIVTHGDGSTHGCVVRDLTTEGDRVVVHLTDDPGFALDAEGNTTWLYFHPEERTAGRPSFSLEAVVLHDAAP